MTKLFSKFITPVEDIVHSRNSTETIRAQLTNLFELSKGLETRAFGDLSYVKPKTGLEELARLLGIKEIRLPVLGDHPEFKHLRTSNKAYENHYVVSVFIDVKNSTKLHRKYNLDQIALIIQSITLAATHICALFGGHIQRLQYDGTFAYFGGKSTTKNDAVNNAILATSFFSYFIKYELADVFGAEDIDNIYTRIGIDFGDDDDVQWLIFGSPQCSELTTNSLHTSLAPKMQSNANSNGIVIGKNVFDRLGSNQIYADFIRDDKNNVDESLRYVYRDSNKGFYYSQHNFNWSTFLCKSFNFIKRDSRGNLFIDFSGNKDIHEREKQRIENLYKTIQLPIITSGSIPITPPAHKFYYDPNNNV